MLLQRWLLQSGKAAAAAKQAKADAAKLWLEIKASALQDLLAWQDAVAQGFLSSAADERSACKVALGVVPPQQCTLKMF